MSEREVARWEEHVLICDSCRREVAASEAYIAAMRSAAAELRRTAPKPAELDVLGPARELPFTEWPEGFPGGFRWFSCTTEKRRAPEKTRLRRLANRHRQVAGEVRRHLGFQFTHLPADVRETSARFCDSR